MVRWFSLARSRNIRPISFLAKIFFFFFFSLFSSPAKVTAGQFPRLHVSAPLLGTRIRGQRKPGLFLPS